MQRERGQQSGVRLREGGLGALALLLVLTVAGSAAAQTASKKPAPKPATAAATIPAALPAGLEASCDSRLQRHRLKNGVEVVLLPYGGVPGVHVRASVHAGTRHDPPGYEGLAHYVEHLTFRPVAGFASVFELYEEAGATGLNATTSLDTTDYYATVPTAQLERALWIEARRLALGLDLLADEPALLERQVLQREHAMRYGKGVQLEARQAVYSALFPSGHPYHRNLASQESQAGLTLSDARWFFARHYRPERVRLVLAGNFDPAQALALAERWFGALAPKGEAAAAPGESSDACTWAKQPLAPGARRLRVSTAGKNESLNVYWPISASEEPEQWRGLLRFVAQQLREAGQQTGLAASVDVDIVRGELGHYYQLSPDTLGTAIHLYVPSAADRSRGDVALMAQALRAGTLHGSQQEPLINPQLGEQPVRIRTNGAGTTFSWHVLPRATRTAVELLGSFVLRPAFEPSEVQIRLQQQLAEIQGESVVFSLHAQRLARAALPTLATPSYEDDARSLLQLTPARLAQIHACAIQPGGAELVVVGPVAADQVLAWASAAFGSWAARAPGAGCEQWQPPVLAPDPAHGRLQRAELQMILNTAGDPRLTIEVPGPALGSPDYVPFLLLTKVLASRRTGAAWELRHAGGSYGIHTSLYEGFPHLTLLEVEGLVDEEAVQPALRGLLADLRGLADNLQEKELEAVKRRSRNELVEALTSNDAVAWLVLNHARRGLGTERLLDAPNELSRVELAQCREVAQRWLSNAEPSMVVTGAVESGLGIRVNRRHRHWTSQPQSHKKAL